MLRDVEWDTTDEMLIGGFFLKGAAFDDIGPFSSLRQSSSRETGDVSFYAGVMINDQCKRDEHFTDMGHRIVSDPFHGSVGNGSAEHCCPSLVRSLHNDLRRFSLVASTMDYPASRPTYHLPSADLWFSLAGHGIAHRPLLSGNGNGWFAEMVCALDLLPSHTCHSLLVSAHERIHWALLPTLSPVSSETTHPSLPYSFSGVGHSLRSYCLSLSPLVLAVSRQLSVRSNEIHVWRTLLCFALSASARTFETSVNTSLPCYVILSFNVLILCRFIGVGTRDSPSPWTKKQWRKDRRMIRQILGLSSILFTESIPSMMIIFVKNISSWCSPWWISFLCHGLRYVMISTTPWMALLDLPEIRRFSRPVPYLSESLDKINDSTEDTYLWLVGHFTVCNRWFKRDMFPAYAGCIEWGYRRQKSSEAERYFFSWSIIVLNSILLIQLTISVESLDTSYENSSMCMTGSFNGKEYDHPIFDDLSCR